MLVINKLKPLYINKIDKVIRMGNFKDTGKEIYYEDESILSVFNNCINHISKEELMLKVYKETNVNIEEIEKAIDYLVNEGFLIDTNKYNNILNDNSLNRENLFFSMLKDDFINTDEILKDKKILILGLGGVGSNVLLILSRAGFKNFILVDCDRVEESNLIRQLFFNKEDIGKLKTDCLKEKLSGYNIKKVNIKIEKEEDIEKEIKESDFVLCTLDKPSRIIRRLINKVCIKENKPVIFAGFSEHVAMVGPLIVPGKSACLMCNEKKLNDEPLNNIEIVPSYGPLCTFISSIISNEIINYYVKFTRNSLLGKTMMFNMNSYNLKIIKWQKNNKCEVCKECK